MTVPKLWLRVREERNTFRVVLYIYERIVNKINRNHLVIYCAIKKSSEGFGFEGHGGVVMGDYRRGWYAEWGRLSEGMVCRMGKILSEGW